MGAVVLGGADAWTGGGGPAAEVRAGTSGRAGPFALAAGGSLEAIDDAGAALLVDQLRASVRWRPPGLVAPAAGVAAAGSIGGPWSSALATVALDVRRPSVRAAIGLGGGLRHGGTALGPEGDATASLDVRLGPLWSSTTGTVRLMGGGLPPLAFDGGQWLSLGDELRLELGLVASAVPGTDAPAVPGLAAPGTVVLQGLAAGALSIAERWSLAVEIGPELARGAVPYERFRALAGVRADLGPSGPRAPVPAPGGTRFELRAPDADRVEVLGAFSEWAAVPMARRSGRWAVELDVPPGSWEFVYRVDGETVVPPAADRYVPDGFGGTNGVVVVP